VKRKQHLLLHRNELVAATNIVPISVDRTRLVSPWVVVIRNRSTYVNSNDKYPEG
jgi:hypothetical protein